MKRVIEFIKREAVLCISFVLALISILFVPVDGKYIEYIDFHTLILLFVLMIIVAGLGTLGVFAAVGRFMLRMVKSAKSIALVLVLSCFLFSMAITNDVALITFVPFAIEVLLMAGLEEYLIRVIVLQTVAANLGSMLTPIGNPQNLYLFSLSAMNFDDFILLMLPYTLLSLAGLVLACFLLIGKDLPKTDALAVTEAKITDKRKTLIYLLLFLFALLSVARLVSVYIVLPVILAVVLIADYKILRKPDYSLLLTFFFLFIFIGNIKRIPEISSWLFGMIGGNELITSVLASQFISNVPAAILLSGFTDNISALIVGTNLGGLGTIIASMASLISFKYYICTKQKKTAAYLGVFTLLNIIFLAALLGFYYLVG